MFLAWFWGNNSGRMTSETSNCVMQLKHLTNSNKTGQHQAVLSLLFQLIFHEKDLFLGRLRPAPFSLFS